MAILSNQVAGQTLVAGLFLKLFLFFLSYFRCLPAPLPQTIPSPLFLYNNWFISFYFGSEYRYPCFKKAKKSAAPGLSKKKPVNI